MTFPEQMITISAVSVGTLLTRFLPFLVFPAGKPTPEYIQYLGKVLAPAVFSLLIVYCLKDVSWLEGSHGIPEILGIAVIAALHLWKRQMLLSIAGGTIFLYAARAICLCGVICLRATGSCKIR